MPPPPPLPLLSRTPVSLALRRGRGLPFEKWNYRRRPRPHDRQLWLFSRRPLLFPLLARVAVSPSSLLLLLVLLVSVSGLGAAAAALCRGGLDGWRKERRGGERPFFPSRRKILSIVYTSVGAGGPQRAKSRKPRPAVESWRERVKPMTRREFRLATSSPPPPLLLLPPNPPSFLSRGTALP